MQHESHRVPVTAVCLWKDDVILTGEGNLLKAYHLQRKTLLYSTPAFESQSIHGIAVADHGENQHVLIWGGQYLRRVHVDIETGPFTQIRLGAVRDMGDWILDVSFNQELNPSNDATAAVVTAHNALAYAHLLESSLDLNLTSMVRPSNCILYAAHVVWLSASKCLIASGTAFGHVILWSCSLRQDLTATFQTHYTFSAHEGSLFGVQISPSNMDALPGGHNRILATCSDDRTVRLWDISDLTVRSPTLTEEQQQTGFGSSSSIGTCSPTLLSKAMGHTSRIWQVHFVKRVLNDDNRERSTELFLVSCGEDATIVSWAIETSTCSIMPFVLRPIRTERAHSGKNVWTMDSNRLNRTITGGADGAATWRLAGQLCQPSPQRDITNLLHDFGGPDNYRSYGFVSKSEMLATTDSGRVSLLGLSSPDGISITEISPSITGIEGYSMVASKPGMAFVGGSSGEVFAYIHTSRRIYKIFETGRKIAALFAQTLPSSAKGPKESTGLLVTNVGAAFATLCVLEMANDDDSSLVLGERFELRLPPGFIVTSFSQAPFGKDNLVVLGSRNGSLAAYVVSSTAKLEPIPHSMLQPEVHGKETVTRLQFANDHPAVVFSTGRDGTYGAHRIVTTADAIQLVTVHQLALPLGPNIGSLGYSPRGSLWVWGFRSKHFVVFDVETQQEVMSVECGGAHRSWSFQMEDHGGTFAWSKVSKLYYQVQPEAPFESLNHGGHGREIKAAAVSPLDARLIATGAEDTDIKLSLYTNGSFRCLHTLQQHNTGIQHLQWSNDGRYLFSSGGFEEFFVWRITQDIPSLGIGVLCESRHAKSGTSDLRIMSFDVQEEEEERAATRRFRITMAYSDSNLRIWSYADKSWQLLTSGDYLTSCLTQCVQAGGVIATASTDGHVAIWKTAQESRSRLQWHLRHKVHQSAILCLATHQLADDSRLIITGGDDNAIGVTRMMASGESPKTLLIPGAHSAAVTAVAVVDVKVDHIMLVSSSIDQRVKLWRLSLDTERHGIEGIDIRPYQNAFTAVADVSSVDRIQCADGSKGVLICGVGMDVWRIS